MAEERMARVLVTVTEDEWRKTLEIARSCPEPDETPEERAKRWLLEDVHHALYIGAKLSRHKGKWFTLRFEKWEDGDN